MAIIHPSVLDPVFEELESELGDEIPKVVVEAQRQITQSGFYSVAEIIDADQFRTQLALRGIGNLKNMVMGLNGLRLTLDNACLHLMVVGMAQGLFELAYDTPSTVEWELSAEGDLEVEVVPKA